MERAQLTELIALNLLWHIKIEDTLTLAQQNPKCLPIPVKIQDPHGQWIEGTPFQIVAAAGDRNPPNMTPEEKNFGLAERLRPCFENPIHCDKQESIWFGPGSDEATAKTMASYIAAIETTCQEIIECKEITDNIHWRDVLTLPIFLQIAENFRQALTPDPNHIVKSGFLFSMQIFLDFITIFEANVNNDNIEDKARLNLGGWRSRKSDAFDAIIYPALQARSQRCDFGIFKKGIKNVAAGQTPYRLDFSNGTPEILSGIGTTHFFGSEGDKSVVSKRLRRWSFTGGAALGLRASFFRSLHQAKTAAIGFTGSQSNHTLSRERGLSI
ncbi:MAG TPA: hypothetical protein VHA13_05835 [Gammaproteobacteria bacterium]|nr:hypothetical protein [Gammaproteobacteria bacterium]